MENFYLASLNTLVKNFLADCLQCQTNKKVAKANTEQSAPTKICFNELIMIDAKGPLMCAPKNNAHYASTASFEHWFAKFGLREEIRSDKVSKYVITDLTHHCKCFEIKFKPSTTCAPWTNGLLEGTIRIIVKLIRTLVDGKSNK